MATLTPTASDPGSSLRAGDRLLLAVGRRGLPWTAALAVAAVGLACAETALPALMGRTIDAVVRGRSAAAPLRWCALALIVLVVCDMLEDLAAGYATARSTSWLRRMLLRHLLAVGPGAATRFTPGDLAGRLVGNAAQAARVGQDTVRAIVGLIPAVGGCVALALIDPWLCVTFLAGTPLLILFVRTFAVQASGLAGRYFAVQGEIAGRLLGAVSGARTIAAAGTLERERRRILEPLPELRGHGIAMWRAQMRLSVQEGVLVPLLEIAVLAVAGAELARGRISPGDLLAASQYVLLATGLGSIVAYVGQLGRSRAGAARGAEILAAPPTAYGAEQVHRGPGRLEFRGVSVSVGGHALGPIDLTVPPGALVAVVGPTGAGKSLLAMLAGRLIDPDAGEVLLDGVPLRRLAHEELRRAVGYGFEDPVLFGETIADAIAFGSRTAGPEEVLAAARAARADEFIRRLPDGYGTPLQAAPMSGGEAQRLGLARTFAHAGNVLILDDVAASLDTVTEHHITEVLATTLADRTRIVIAHRTATAARADRVVWLDQGSVRAIGSHAELWACEEYRALFGSGEFTPEAAV